MSVLPVTRVVLYKHGVGYFEREGRVAGDDTLTLIFKQGEVSDVLKSLTVLDLDGGHVTAVSYDSTKPIEQLLNEIALSIPDDGSLFGLIPQLKGARVRVSSDVNVEGMLVGVDTTDVPAGDGSVRQVRASVFTDAGEVATFPLYDARIHLLDEGLKRDLDFYLRTQLSAKKKDARSFTLFASGAGERTVRMSYVLEAPVWKATYRILLNGEEPPLIQGWAVVDNMQDDDWSDVRLSLVAGLPVSFVHDLYTPRYIRRPVVAVQETTGVLPPTVESGMYLGDSDGNTTTDCDPDEQSVGVRRMRKSAALAAPMAAGGRGEYLRDVRSQASSVPTQVRERVVGDLFEYEIEKPVTIRRNQSALVPIVLKPFAGKPVLLYQKVARAENPMRCVEFENTTGLTLEGGPVTVLDGGSYVGEAMLETMKPKEERLVPYAVELGVRVMDSVGTHNEAVSRTVIRQGTLWTHYAQTSKTTYLFISKADKEQTLYLDHPRGGTDWELTDTPTPHEVTDNYWRFKLPLPANKTTKVVVRLRRPLHQTISLATVDDKQVRLWLTQKYLDAKTAEALKHVLDLRRQVAAAEGQLAALDQERKKIHEEQKRIRENLNSLGERASEKELRERYVKALNAQEDRLEKLDAEVRSAQGERDAVQGRMAEAMGKIEYEGTVDD